MFEIYQFNEGQILLFGMMLVRISSCIVVMPILGSRDIPAAVKVLLSLLITFVLFTSQKNEISKLSFDAQNIIVLMAREAFVGTFIGFLTRGIFWGVQVAGQILGFTLGFSSGQLFNPSLGDSGTVIETFQSILAMLLFLSINGHHWMIEALAKSFDLAPLAQVGIKSAPLVGVGQFVQSVFLVALKLAGPMMAVIIFLNASLGVVGRAVPQINVFVISFPVNILVGLFVFMVSIPLLLAVMENDFSELAATVFKFIKAF